MILRIRIVLLLVMLATSASWAQPIRCATMEQDSINRARNPRRGSLDEFEQALQRKIRELAEQRRMGNTVQAVLLNIPIIVHVVHNGEAVGSGTNLSEAQIESQIVVLNEDFRRLLGTPGHNTHPDGADIEIEFCLSPVDENGNTMTEPGIHRYDGNQSSWTRAQIEGMKPLTIWNPNQFFNIWTLRFGGVDANLLGYAQFPDQSGLSGLNEIGGSASTDGVVVQYSSFGFQFPNQSPPYNKGRTLSHETGHWLGLRHIWGDGNCGDDFVSDTPEVASPTQGCPSNRLACDNITPAMVENYMDYSDDACQNIFTNGQKTRMRAVMDMSPRRSTLIENSLCLPFVPDVPTANFVSDKQLVLLGGQVNFTDLSSNFPNAWNWTFEGGDPNSSTLRNPTVRYFVPGTYTVTLTATNTLGSSAPLEIIGYITVSEDGLCSTVTNFDPGYTPTLIPMSDFGSFTGYLTGHNSAGSQAVSEYFANELGYEYVSGVEIKFGHLASTVEDDEVTVVVWNARGPQSAPGSVIERKTVLVKQIQDDIDADRTTTIVFDRETPVFSRAFQVGIELDGPGGETVAILSSADGEATNSTSWVKNNADVWMPFSVAYGANISMDIKPIIGVNPSVQISASELLVYPNEEVVLNGRGASIFVWNSDDGTVTDFPGPQLVVRPTETTTYTALGSGLELCNTSASTTIYIRETVTGIADTFADADVTIFPNPGSTDLNITIQNDYRGTVRLGLYSMQGVGMTPIKVAEKTEKQFQSTLETATLSPGMYILQMGLGERRVFKKWLKH